MSTLSGTEWRLCFSTQVVADWWLCSIPGISSLWALCVFVLWAAVVGFGPSPWLNSTTFLCQNNISNKDVICALYLNPAPVFHSVCLKCIIPQMETSSSLWHWHKPLNFQLESHFSKCFTCCHGTRAVPASCKHKHMARSCPDWDNPEYSSQELAAGGANWWHSRDQWWKSKHRRDRETA